MKEKKTSAEPVSSCNKAIPAGINIRMKAYIQIIFFSDEVLDSLKSFAKASAVANLANSMGCKLILPILIHALAPEISVPKNKTKILSNRKKI